MSYHVVLEHYRNVLFDTNLSFLELFVIEIVAVLLVYPLRLQVVFLLYLKLFLDI